MFRNYLKVGVTGLARQKFHTLINVLGLAIGLAGCFLVAGYVRHEINFESGHANHDRIYRIINCPENYFASHISNVPAPLVPAVRESCPDVEKITRLRRTADVAVCVGRDVFKADVMYLADPEILEMFSLPLAQGNAESALDAPFQIIISPELARKHFGSSDPVGRTVRVAGQIDCQVTGVFGDIATNTQMKCDILGSYSTLEAVGEDITSWDSRFTDYAYLLLRPGADPDQLEAKLAGVVSAHVKPDERGRLNPRLQRLREIYLYSHGVNELRPSGNLTLIYLSCTIALLILVVGVINFINLATARAVRRVREIGLRKVLGANRGHVIGQLLIESIMVSSMAGVIGLALFEISKPWFVVFVGHFVDLGPWHESISLLFALSLTLLVGLLAGAFPALLLSRLTPARSLRGGIESGSVRSLMRQCLVVFQFSVAIALIALTVVIHQQVSHCTNRDVGFAREGRVILELSGRQPERVSANSLLLKEELLRSGAAAEVSASFAAPGENRVAIGEFADIAQPDAKAEAIVILPVDYEYADFYGLTLLEGRQLSRDFADGDGRSLLLTEAAARTLGLQAPAGARLTDGEDEYDVVGIIADFNPLPASYQEFPVALHIAPDSYARVSVKLPPGDLEARIGDLRTAWQRILPEEPFNYVFLEDLIAGVYQDSTRLGQMGTVFSALAVLVACLGILGLISHAVERRTREIGVRKVLGSSTLGILRLFTGETVALIGISLLIALPLVWYLGDLWLQRFVDRIEIGPWPFVAAGFLVLFIAISTVVSLATRAARANPVKALRYE